MRLAPASLEAWLPDLRHLRGVRVWGPPAARDHTACVSLTVEGWHPSAVAEVLDQRFGIATRAGLHCAPLAHRTLGTFPTGTVRPSLGWRTTAAELDAATQARRALAWVAAHREAAACACT